MKIKHEWELDFLKKGFTKAQFNQIWTYRARYQNGDRSEIALIIYGDYRYFKRGEIGSERRAKVNVSSMGEIGSEKRAKYNARVLKSIGEIGSEKRKKANASTVRSMGEIGSEKRAEFYVKSRGKIGSEKRAEFYVKYKGKIGSEKRTRFNARVLRSMGEKGSEKRQAYYDRFYGSTPNHERLVENFLVKHLDLIEPGLTFVDRQVQINHGKQRIDMIAKDFLGRITLIELKVVTANIGAFRQLAKYMNIYARENATGLPRGLIVAPGFSKRLIEKIREDSYIEPKLFVVQCNSGYLKRGVKKGRGVTL